MSFFDPNSWIWISPSDKLLSENLICEISTSSFVSISIRVPPLKSIPKFNPNEKKDIREPIIKIDEKIKPIKWNFINDN